MDAPRIVLRGLSRISAVLSFLFLMLAGIGRAQWTSTDIGSVGATGSDSYASTTGVYTLNGAGAGLSGTADACHYLYQALSGDGMMQARVVSVTNTNSYARAGVMIRQSTGAGAIELAMSETPGAGVTLTERTSANGSTTSTQVVTTGVPYWVRVVKVGSLVTYYRSPDGVTWTFVGGITYSWSGSVDIGLTVSSHVSGTICTATFDNVTLVSQPSLSPPFPWADQDIGAPSLAGAIYLNSPLWSIYAGGTGLAGTADQIHFAYQGLNGNGEVIAQVNSLSYSGASAGVIIRQDLTSGSAEAAVALNGTNYVKFATRTSANASLSSSVGPVNGGSWLKLVRTGNTFYAYQSADGMSWTARGSQTISMTGTVYVGIYGSSNSSSQLTLAALDQVFVVPSESYLTTGMIDLGASHDLYLLPNGNVWAWGLNSSGQIGDGTLTTRTSPVVLSSLSNIVAVSAGSTHSMALANDGTVWVWGNDSNGQLGDGGTTQRSTPYHLTTLSNIVAISAGGSHSLALANDGTVWVWGNDNNGQLGDGGNSQRTSPYHLTSLSGIVAISAGGNHSLALRDDGTVFAWGDNAQGQLGDGTLITRNTPEALSGISGISSISAGTNHSLALAANGAVWAWGDNSFGEVGDQSTAMRENPVAVISSSSGVVSVLAGNYFSLALTNTGAVYAWGDNSSGQLGIGNLSDQNVPVQVPGLAGVVSIGAGGGESAALFSGTQNIVTWGANNSGQLGNGSTGVSSAPQQLVPPAITSPNSAAAYLNVPFSFNVTASSAPTSYSASGLPSGLSINSTTGQISGTPSSGGIVTVSLTATNIFGTGSAVLTLTVTANSPWTSTDIGSVGVVGSDSYNSSTGVYTLNGSGANIYGNADACHYLYQTIPGDATLQGRVVSISNTSANAKVGVMIRQSTSAGDVEASVVETYSAGVALLQRTTKNGSTTKTVPTTAACPYWVKIVKSGTTITSYYSPDGVNWTSAGSTTYAWTGSVDIGLVDCSANNSALCTATIDNVTLTTQVTQTSLPAGLIAWFEGDSLPSPGSAVATWSDSSGNGAAISQSASNQPKVATDPISGRSVVQFSGSKWLNNTLTYGTLSSVTIVTVASPVDTSSQYGMIEIGRGYGNTTAFGMADNYGTLSFLNGWPSGYVNYLGNGAFGPTGDLSVNTAIYANSSTSNYAADTAYLFNNGTAQSPISVTVGSNSTRQYLSIGDLSDYGTVFWNGTVAEVLVFNSALTPSQRQQVELYLADKYLTYAPGATWITTYDSEQQSQINSNHWSKAQADQYVELENALPVASGLTCWFKADASFVQNGGGTVWYDSSLNDYDITQGTGNAPTLSVDSLSGQPVVNFNGSDFIETTSLPQLAGGNDDTIIVVASDTMPNQASALVTVGNATGAGTRELLIDANNNLSYFDGTNVATGGQASIANTGSAANLLSGGGTNSLNVYSLTYSTSATTASFYSDGSPSGSPSTSISSTPLVQGLTLGSKDYYQPLQGLDGNIAEVLVYNRVLSTTERQEMELYLANKYRLPYYMPAPTISPNGGSASSSLSVTLSGEPSPVAIYYTLDGSTPTTSSFRYNGSLTLTQSAPITCAFFLNGVLASPTSTAQFYVNDYLYSGADTGISNAWITQYNLSGISPSALASGGSGLTYLQAYLWGYSPAVYSTNGDGLSDLENRILGYSATNLDINNYGLTNSQQLVLGLDPFDTNINPPPSPTPTSNAATTLTIQLINPPGAVQVQ